MYSLDVLLFLFGTRLLELRAAVHGIAESDMTEQLNWAEIILKPPVSEEIYFLM